MAALYPFRALRPKPADASRVASVPYDVVTTDEARALADDNPLSFLRVSRPEIEFPAGTDPYAEEVYRRAAANFEALKRAALVLDDDPSVYFYRLTMGGHEQTGLAACFSLDDYDRDVIRKHERTRRDKEDDRTRHMLALGAQTGPVFLIYRASTEVNDVAARVSSERPLYDFEAPDGVRHTVWRAGTGARDRLVAAFGRIPVLYIADGHHRAASAARARTAIEAGGGDSTDLGDGADYRTMLAVAFPHDQVQVLPYNRVVKNLAGLSAAAFLEKVREEFDPQPGPPSPERAGEIAMYLNGSWLTLRARVAPAGDPVSTLDVSVLQDRLLAPILGIADIRADKRIDFIGGARGTAELERQVDCGEAAVAFSLYPVGVADLMAVSDEGAIMPPKSTWFEPKLRDGLLSHVI
jgi:uncharacterized protein (DUF1015 family)